YFRNAQPGHRVRVATVRGPQGFKRCRTSCSVARTRRGVAGQDTNYCFRVFRSRTHAQPSRSDSNARRQLEWFRGGCRGRHGPVRTTVERLALSYQVNILELPTDFCELTGAARLIAAYEGSRTHAPRHREHGDQIGRKLAQLVDEGLRIPVSQYHAALALIAD